MLNGLWTGVRDQTLGAKEGSGSGSRSDTASRSGSGAMPAWVWPLGAPVPCGGLPLELPALLKRIRTVWRARLALLGPRRAEVALEREDSCSCLTGSDPTLTVKYSCVLHMVNWIL